MFLTCLTVCRSLKNLFKSLMSYLSAIICLTDWSLILSKMVIIAPNVRYSKTFQQGAKSSSGY